MKDFEENYSYEPSPMTATASFPRYASPKEIKRSRLKVNHRYGYRFVKRLFDFAFALVLSLILLAPVALILLINMIPTKGHPIYFDHRVGKGGKMISVLKVRSMYIDANDHPEKYLNEEQMAQFLVERKVDNDPRITKFGRIIRKTSLDELPQIFNILVGNMSFVGPRPISKKEYELNFTPKQRQKLVTVKPGLLGNWAVHGRSNVTFESGERQEMELDYVRNRGVLTDLKIMFAAVPAVLNSRGAK